MTRLYSDLAAWWPLLSDPADYAEEAEFYLRALENACDEPPRTLLELGSGGGNNASHMKAGLELTLVDPAPGMLDVSRRLNPECEHIEGDMRTVRLGRRFDCVFIHDAICYMTTPGDLAAAVETAFVHCRPGGAALFAPDHVRETFQPSTRHGGHDEAEGEFGGGRGLRYRHIEGLFPRQLWLDTLRDTGFEPERIPFPHSELPPDSYEVFVGRRLPEH